MGDIRVAQKVASKIGVIPGLLRRTLRRVGGQVIVLGLILLDIGGLAFALAAPVWLAPWVTMNLTVFALGALSWSEDKRIQSESATAMQRQAEKVNAAKRRNIEERQREVQRQQEVERLSRAEEQLKDAEQRQRQAEEERETQRLQQAEQAERLRQAEQQLREAEQRLHQEQEAREAQILQQAEQAERLRQAEEQLREAEHRQLREEEERETHRLQQAEQAERLRQTEQQLREAEQRLRQEQQAREAQRKRQRKRAEGGAQFRAEWWVVLGVTPRASKDEIASNYRRRVKQYHPDRVVGLAPEFVELAEERTKALNEAYENAMRTRWPSAA
jgi:flagellar biosynthesis GTPase FlhF